MTQRTKKRATLAEAYAYAVALLAARPDVTGIDIGPGYKRGKKKGRQQVIRVHVRKKIADKKQLSRSERIPEDFLGVPSDVIEATYTRQSTPFLPSGRFDPIRPGISVGNPKAKAGTIGLIVFDRKSGAPCLLSSSHVLAGPHFEEGDPIIQPSRLDNGKLSNDVVAKLFHAPAPGLWGDAALARLSNARRFDRALFDTRVVIDSAEDPRRGQRVTKVGRTTFTTHGRIEGTGTYFYPDLPSGVQGFRVVPHHDDPTKPDLCAAGDSGAVYYLAGSTTGVGLHCAGGTDPALGEVGIACNLTTVLSTLDATLSRP